MLKLPNNEPEAEEADGDVNETYDKIDDYWGGGGGGVEVEDNKGEGDIDNKYSEDAACFFWGEKASAHADFDDDDDDDGDNENC